MKRVSKWLAVASLALGIAMLISPTFAKPAQDAQFLPATHQAETPWKAVAASGSVQARPVAAEQAVWHPVGRGDELSPRTLIETGKKSRATLTRNASLLVLDPSSRVELPGDGSGRMETSVVQTQGSVMYKVDSRSNPHFEVVTPFLVAGVKGTSFLVTVNDDYTSIVVESGRVEVTNPGTGGTMMLGPGESILRQRDELAMDLVHEQRRTKQIRREVKRLDRIRQANDAVLGPLDSDSDDGSAGDDLVVDAGTDDKDAVGDKNTDGWADDSALDDTLVSPGDDLLRDEVEAVTKELIEELIREEIHDGVIKAPDEDVVIINLPPVLDPGGPTTPGGTGSPDPVDINQLP